MSQAIRSEVDKSMIEYCAYIILNLARYKPTFPQAYRKVGLLTVSQMLWRWCDKECNIFNTLCTVIWLFAQNPVMNKVIILLFYFIFNFYSYIPSRLQQIRDYMTTRDSMFVLGEIKKMVLRKENMRRNKAPNPLFPKLTPQQRRQMPELLPDFGLRRAKDFAYIFNCSVFAFDTILAKLNIIDNANP